MNLTEQLPRPAVPPPADPPTQPAVVVPADPPTLRLPSEHTTKMPVNNDRARQDPPTVQMPAMEAEDPPTVRVRVPRPARPWPAAGAPQVDENVPQPPPQLPPPPRETPAEDEHHEEQPEVEVPAQRRGGRKLVLLGFALVAVVALGAGAVFGGPTVLTALGLGGPSTTTVPPPAPLAPTPQLRPATTGTAPTSDGVKAALAGPASSPALGTLTGSVVDPTTGSTLWDSNSGTPLTPASAGKLLTTSAALLSLDPQTRFTTTVVAGSEPGTVVLVGGGDPTLSSLPVGKESVYPGAAHLDDLVAQVRKAAGGPVRKVLVDTSRYTGDGMAPGWDSNDIAGGSWSPISPVMLDGGRSKPTEQDPPRTPTPDLDAAKELAKRLGADPAQSAKGSAPSGSAVLGSVSSAPLTDLVDNLLEISDNVLAEAVGREVARSAGDPASFSSGSQAVLKVLRDNKFDLTGVTMVDGSGLSTNDRVTSKLLSSILTVAAGPDGGDPRTAKLRPLLNGLPVAGGTGTLASRYKDANSVAGKGLVRAKTGTLSNVNTLAGVVLDTEGRVLVFALMSNGSNIDSGRAALDVLAATLRGCGCH
ncbi:hypothetical protein GCM10010174_23570 [Kutzneria viridogrisea]|uniref:D-alanyl-D-alanine carboxypeptidase/D-alanyl-D-alanine-endopeptidase (Penicillin-binding protein 4) n=1 Tax=Kutzneria viridogrisea TaxID=47990 RepID=A0ABR6BWI6_9PSEU|nr:D-alanyl-D-alanine carboxypeptidase/D-alanyl-D-alanine-endopeptidase (penicillin-binding protein 4) [Kutzneria viridogrisea]